MKSITLCGNAGPLPEFYSQFINSDGDLQFGDAFGLEAQYLISQVTFADKNYFPESEWSLEQIESDSITVGCHICGDEVVDSIYETCEDCQLFELII